VVAQRVWPILLPASRLMTRQATGLPLSDCPAAVQRLRQPCESGCHSRGNFSVFGLRRVANLRVGQGYRQYHNTIIAASLLVGLPALTSNNFRAMPVFYLRAAQRQCSALTSDVITGNLSCHRGRRRSTVPPTRC